jgi:hypothetical protein
LKKGSKNEIPWIWRSIGKSQRTQQSSRTPIRKGLQFKLSEHWRTDMETSIQPYGIANSQKTDPGQ